MECTQTDIINCEQYHLDISLCYKIDDGPSLIDELNDADFVKFPPFNFKIPVDVSTQFIENRTIRKPF